jgi:hypothetical protein
MTSDRVLLERRLWRQLEAAREAVTASSTSYRATLSANERLAAAVSRYTAVVPPQVSRNTSNRG